MAIYRSVFRIIEEEYLMPGDRIIIERDWLEEQWLVKKHSAEDIAKDIGCSIFTIYDRVRRYGFYRKKVGCVFSEDVRKKISDRHKKNIQNGYVPPFMNWWKGKKRSDEWKSKRSKDCYNRYKLKFSDDKIVEMYTQHNMSSVKIADLCGCHWETIVRRLKRNEVKTKGAKCFLKGRKLSDEHIRKCLKRSIPTSLEEKFDRIVKDEDLPYKFVGDGSLVVNSCNPDFIHTKGKKIAVEVYAKYFKQIGNRSIEKWQKERGKKFKEGGWDIYYFDETQVNTDNILSQLST